MLQDTTPDIQPGEADGLAQQPNRDDHYMPPNNQKSSPRPQDEAVAVLRSDVQIAKHMAQKRDADAWTFAEGRIWRYFMITAGVCTWQAIPEDELRREAAEYDGPATSLNKARIDSYPRVFWRSTRRPAGFLCAARAWH
jgi:hypothetical protein